MTQKQNRLLTKSVNSFQKLQLLLFLGKHPNMQGTCQEFGERLYFGNTPLLEEMIKELSGAGLVEQIENRYQLSPQPEVQLCLQHLTAAFEHPITRQQMINQMRPATLFQNHAYNTSDNSMFL